MENYNERLLDRKIAKKLQSTSGILLKGIRFCGKSLMAASIGRKYRNNLSLPALRHTHGQTM